MKSIPTIEEYKSLAPHSIGIVSDRDIKFLKGVKDVNPQTTMIFEACVEDVYTVSPPPLTTNFLKPA